MGGYLEGLTRSLRPEWRTRSRRGLVAGLSLAAALCLAQLAGASGPQIVAGPPLTFTDPSGDSGTAPDITSVVVSNDANGRIDVHVDVPGQATLASDALLFLVMNTDNNPNTGAPNTFGAEYYFALYGDDQTYGLYRWNGSDWADVPTGTETVSWTNGAHIAFDPSQLGNLTELTFYAKTLQGSGGPEDGRVDFAPDYDTWTYVIPLQVPTPPSIGSKQVLVATAGTARAGKPYAVKVTLRLVVDGQTYIVGPDQLSCVAKVDGRRVKSTVKPSGLAWACAMVVPKSVRGKTLVLSLKGKVDLSTDAGDVSTSFAKSVRTTVH